MLSDKRLQFAAALLVVWWLMRRIEGVSDIVVQLIWLTFLLGGFVLCFVYTFRFCFTGLTKEPEKKPSGNKKKKPKKKEDEEEDEEEEEDDDHH